MSSVKLFPNGDAAVRSVRGRHGNQCILGVVTALAVLATVVSVVTLLVMVRENAYLRGQVALMTEQQVAFMMEQRAFQRDLREQQEGAYNEQVVLLRSQVQSLMQWKQDIGTQGATHGNRDADGRRDNSDTFGKSEEVHHRAKRDTIPMANTVLMHGKLGGCLYGSFGRDGRDGPQGPPGPPGPPGIPGQPCCQPALCSVTPTAEPQPGTTQPGSTQPTTTQPSTQEPIGQCDALATYYGKLIGSFPTGQAGLAGTVYAVDANRLQIVGFSFDGSVPARFRAGDTDSPSGVAGVVVPDEQGRTTLLGAYSNSKLGITLPAGTTVDSIKWLAVWGQNSNLGHLTIPDNFVYPSPRRIGEFTRYAHGVRSREVTILNAKTFRIESLHYDGFGPDAYFWAGLTGTAPNIHGFKVPDESGSFDQKARRYTGQTIEIMLPGEVTVYDIKWVSLWCVSFTENFGHVTIPAPADLNVPPYPVCS